MSFEGGPTALPPQTGALRAAERIEPTVIPVGRATPAGPQASVAPPVAPMAPKATIAPVAAVAPFASQPASAQAAEPTTVASVPAAAPARKPVLSVVPADWDEQISKPAPAPQVAKPAALKPASEAPAVAKPMRSLEEVRADLARLRANAKERHTPVPVKRDTHFEPTDFQDFVVPDPRPTPDSYAPTAYMGFTNLKPLVAAPRDDKRKQ
jgi:hypothetical protein